MSQPATPIGIAVVEHEGTYLVGKRDQTSSLAGQAEFPGGKCEADESSSDCALRECLEETGLGVEPVELLLQRTFDYPHGRVDLSFWLCRPADAADVSDKHHGFRWVARESLAGLSFPAANQPVIAMLTSRE